MQCIINCVCVIMGVVVCLLLFEECVCDRDVTS